MRQLLMSIMLVLTVALLFTAVAGGEGGMKEQVTTSGERMADAISRISP